MATLSESGFGLGCAVDPKSGNLAVSNPQDINNPYSERSGSLAIFPHASGSPTMHYSKKFPTFWHCGYDNKGNLYASTAVDTGGYQLVRMNAGSALIKPITLSRHLYGSETFVPLPQWDGNEMTVSSTVKPMTDNKQQTGLVNVYRLAITGTSAKIIGTTALKNALDRQRGETWISGHTIVGIAYDKFPEISFWRFPGGGNPIWQFRHSKLPYGSMVEGVTISVAPTRK